MDIEEKLEEGQLFRQKAKDNSGMMFQTKGSSGANPLRLAQICSVFDYVMIILGWQDKPIANLPKFLTQYQASINAKYHNDYKDVLVAEEIERKRAERKGISIMQQ